MKIRDCGVMSQLARSYVAPFCSPSSARLHFAFFIALFGLAALTVSLGFDLAALGMAPMLTFCLIRFPLTGALLFWTFTGFRRADQRVFTAVLIVMALTGLGLLIQAGPVETSMLRVLILAAGFAALEGAYWTVWHMNMLCATSESNRTNEMSCAAICMSMGGVAGAVFTGFSIGMLEPEVVLGAAGMLVLAAFAILLRHAYTARTFATLRATPETRGILETFTCCRMRSASTFLQGSQQLLADFLMPVWFKLMGVTGLSAGLLYAVNIGSVVLAGPMADRLCLAGGRRDVQTGSLLKIASWTPLLFLQTPLLATATAVVWKFGAHISNIGLSGRWYSGRSLNALACREAMLSSGRTTMAAIAVPVLYTAVENYSWLGIGAALAMYLCATAFQARSHVFAQDMRSSGGGEPAAEDILTQAAVYQKHQEP